MCLERKSLQKVKLVDQNFWFSSHDHYQNDGVKKADNDNP